MECVVLNALVTHALCRLISCAFGERNTSSSTRRSPLPCFPMANLKRCVLRTSRSTFRCSRPSTRLSRKRIGANFRRVSARILERRACVDLKVIVAGLAPNVILPIVAVASAAPLPVNKPHFSRAIDLIQRRTDHLTWQIFTVGGKHGRSRIRSGTWSPRRRGPDIARSQIRHRKQAERRHADLS